MAKIKICIDTDGTLILTGIEFIGDSCLNKMKNLEEMLGTQIGSRIMHPESETQQQQTQIVEQ